MIADSPQGRALIRRYPRYLALAEEGTLVQRIAEARAVLGACRLCPRNCAVDRIAGETGVCGIGERAMVSSAHPHYGEEAPLVGTGGSGTIFLSGCNLKCIFCQNYEISQEGAGGTVSAAELASMMLGLQELECHNCNLVSPTHVVPQILEALGIAVAEGFRLPIVYNTGGYDSMETIRLLDGIVDIYMPDVKYLSPELAERYSNAADYPAAVTAAVREMHRQVGELEISREGVAERGLLVRHLVMPGAVEDAERVMRFLAEEISPDTYVNVMRQYHPCYHACSTPPIDRPVTTAEWRSAVEAARRVGLRRLDRG